MDEEVDENFRAQIRGKFDELNDSVARLLKRAESSVGVKSADAPRCLNVQPPAGAQLAIFVEFEDCVCTIDTERTLLPSFEDNTEQVDERRARQARLATLSLSLASAMEQLEHAGAALAPGFQDFAELCCMHGVQLHVLSRGFKDVIRHFLRQAGLGHIQVLANDLVVSNGKWSPCFRDNSATGHDKARSLKRAVGGSADLRIVLVANAASDVGPIEAGLVHHAYAPPASALATQCQQAGFHLGEFAGWPQLSRELLAQR